MTRRILLFARDCVLWLAFVGSVGALLYVIEPLFQ